MSSADATTRPAATPHSRIAAAVAALGASLALAGGAQAQSIYVDDDAAPGGDGRSWETALTSIREAIELARTHGSSDDTINIAEGFYEVVPPGGSPEEALTPTSGMTFLGGFGKVFATEPGAAQWIRDSARYVTVIDGGRGTPTPGDDSAVLFRPAADADTVVNGITFRHATRNAVELTPEANLELIDCRFENFVTQQGVILAEGADWLTLDGCTIVGSRTAHAPLLVSDLSVVNLWQTRFSDNQVTGTASGLHGGAAHIVNTIARVYSSTFSRNSSPGDGGALHIEDSPDRVEIWDCIFDSNTAGQNGGAVSVEWGWYTRIERCRFTGNQAARGGAFNGTGARPEIESSLFTHNQSSEQGGAIAGSSVDATNCTFVTNHSGHATGGAIATFSPWLTNCIIWGNTTALPAPSLTHQQVAEFDAWTFRDCIIAGLSDRWNLDMDPKFRSPTDLRLQPGSPAINIANGWYLKSWWATDLDGSPRTVGGFVDAGCYEADVPVACGVADLGGQPMRGLPNYRIPDGVVNNDDFFTYLDAYSRGDRAADLTRTIVRLDPNFGVPDGVLSHTDFIYYLMMFEEGCD